MAKQLQKKNNTSIARGKDNPKELVVQEMSLVSPDRNRKDVGILKSSIQRAESIHLPNRSALYDIYHDIITLDGHLSGLIEKRIGAVLNKSLKYVDKKKEKIDAFDALIYSNKFSTLIKLIIESKLWGISGVEFVVGKEFDFEAIPRKHIRPEQGIITLSQYSNEGIPIKELPYVWTIGEKNDLGKLLQCSMYALYKRSGFGDFAQYVEIFGQPVRIIYYDAYDTKTKDDLRKLLNESGSSLAMMIPKQAQFQMLDGKTSNGNGELQIQLIRACKEEMSIAILGNSETTTSSSSSGYAQANIHSKQQLEITKSDLAFVQNGLNEPQFLRILQSYGFPVTEGGAFEFEMEIDLETLIKRLEIDMKVSEKVPYGDDYWYFTYGIPKPKNYDELKKQQEAWRQAKKEAEDVPGKKSDNDPDDDSIGNKPKEKSLLAGDDDIVIITKDKGILQKGIDFLFGAKKKVSLSEYYNSGSVCPCCGGHGHSLFDLSDMEGWDNIYEDIARKLLDAKLNTGDIHPGLYFETAKQLLEGMDKGLGGSSFDYNDSRNVLKSYLTRNIYHFSAAKSMTEMLEFRNLMYDKKTKEILPFGEFKRRVVERGKSFNEAYLQTEYDTALQSTIMAHKWNALNTEYLEFSTVGDDRVRPEHAKLDKLTYPKNHQIWNKMYPPLDWNCRCTVVPGIASKYRSSEADRDEKYVGKMVKDTIFDNNTGKTRLIFDTGHPYYANMDEGTLKELSFKNYGLLPVEKIRTKYNLNPVSSLQSKEDYEAYWNSMLNHDKGIVLKDPLGQHVLFPDYDLTKKGRENENFKQHILSRKDDADRYKLIANLGDIMQKPSEVWSVMKKGDKEPVTTHYLKFYEDKTLLVVAVNNEARTIFDLSKTGYKTRSGILLYRK